DVTVAAGGHESLDDEVAARVAAAAQPAPGHQQHLGDRATWVGRDHVGKPPLAVRPQRGHQQLGLAVEVRVERSVAYPGGCGDVGHASTVVSALGEDVCRRCQQALTG